MNRRIRFITKLLMVSISLQLTFLPVCAAANDIAVCSSVTPRFNNVINASLSIGFGADNMVYCSIGISPYLHCTGISGIMKLFDSDGTCLAVWSVSDYDRPIGAEFSHQGVYGETYTATC